MRALTVSEQRTIRLGAMTLAALLVLLLAVRVVKFVAQQRSDYLKLVVTAQQLKSESKMYPDKVALVKKLMDDFQLDPAKLVKNSVMAEASAAIQKAANSDGVKPGAIRETPGRAAKKELGTIQFEGTGSVTGVMGLLHRLPLLGFPLVIDAVQITADPMRPGQIKMAVTIVVWDFEAWKKTEATHA